MDKNTLVVGNRYSSIDELLIKIFFSFVELEFTSFYFYMRLKTVFNNSSRFMYEKWD